MATENFIASPDASAARLNEIYGGERDTCFLLNSVAIAANAAEILQGWDSIIAAREAIPAGRLALARDGQGNSHIARVEGDTALGAEMPDGWAVVGHVRSVQKDLMPPPQA